MIVATLTSAVVAPARAEHRVALLIGNSQYQAASLASDAQDLQPLADALQRTGVRCQIKANLTNEQLKQTIASFADASPTAGTAIVFFAGQTAAASDGVHWLGVDARPERGYPLAEALTALHARGGSRVNIVIIDAPQSIDCAGESPDDCLVAYTQQRAMLANLEKTSDLLQAVTEGSQMHRSTLPQGTTVKGPASPAISPPDKFVQGEKPGDEWVNARGMVFVWCPPGKFTSGSPADEPGRYPDEQQAEIAIEDGFWIGKYELTNRENPRGVSRDAVGKLKNHPVTKFHWDDGRAALEMSLTQQEQQSGRLPQDWHYSMPSEAQWEYAARAGSQAAYHFGDDASQLADYANFADKSWYDTGEIYSQRAHRNWNDGAAKLALVGNYKPNAWGLHDVHGNVLEWCDNFAARGGSWVSTPESCRVAFRNRFGGREDQIFLGYRVAIRRMPMTAK